MNFVRRTPKSNFDSRAANTWLDLLAVLCLRIDHSTSDRKLAAQYAEVKPPSKTSTKAIPADDPSWSLCYIRPIPHFRLLPFAYLDKREKLTSRLLTVANFCPEICHHISRRYDSDWLYSTLKYICIFFCAF
jgi:hypothetical protein